MSDLYDVNAINFGGSLSSNSQHNEYVKQTNINQAMTVAVNLSNSNIFNDDNINNDIMSNNNMSNDNNSCSASNSNCITTNENINSNRDDNDKSNDLQKEGLEAFESKN